jgi:hypothetical protein
MDQSHWGEMSIDLMPTPPDNMVGAIPYFDGVQWQFIRIVAGGSMEIVYNSVEQTLEISSVDIRLYGSYIADAIILRVESGTFNANAVLVV